MPALRMTFKGWKAVGAIASILLASLLYGINWPRNDLGPAFAKPVIAYLQAEQTRRVLAEYAPNGSASLNREQLQKYGEAAQASQRIAINSLEVRGSFRTAVARVNYSVNGNTPPDGRAVRHLLLKNSYLGGWFVDRGTTALSYYFAL